MKFRVVCKLAGARFSGLGGAEIELPTADAVFEKPDWLGQEVTGDRRYYNSQLTKAPYCKWHTEK